MQKIISRLNQWARSKAFIYYPIHYVHWVLVYFAVRADWQIQKFFTRFNHDGLNKTEHRDRRIIASITSYPARINIVPYAIASILNQTMKPDKIILWLGSDRFPDKKLPRIFKKLKRCGVDIEFREDLGPHTKYFYAMKEYPEDLIITFDDDVIYHGYIIESLYKSYLLHPKCVCAMRTVGIKFTQEGIMAGYLDFDFAHNEPLDAESHSYIPEGICGVLYPPHTLHDEVFNIEAMKRLCPKADDIWLKIMELLNDTKVASASESPELPGRLPFMTSSAGAFWPQNGPGGGNDVQMKAVIDAYNTWPSNGKTLIEMLREDSNGVE